MRVLMLSELYPPFIGGSEEYVRNLARGLVARGHEVEVATIAADNEPTTRDEDGVVVHRLRSTVGRLGELMPSGRPYSAPAPDPDVVAALRHIVTQQRPEIVHAHNWMVHSFLPLKPFTDARLVMTLHDYSIVCAKRSLLYRASECSGPGLEKCLRCAGRNYGAARGPAITFANWALAPLLLRAVDCFVPVSTAVARRNGLAGSDTPHEVIPNFVPDDVLARADTSDPALAALPDVPFWLYAGALSRHKGIHTLLDAYERLHDAPPLVVIGRAGPDAPQALPDGVTLLTDVAHDAVMAAWQRAAIGIVPSLFPDPCPTVALEAMAAGVPVVGSRNGGLPDLVLEGETGLLVAPGDVDALRGALSRLCLDEPARAQMGRAAAARAPAFMASAVVPRIEAVYQRLAA